MEDFEKNKKGILFSILGILIFCIAILPIYNLTSYIERKSCYPKIAEHLDIRNAKNYMEMQLALLGKARLMLHPNMKRDEVLGKLQTIAPIHAYTNKNTLDGRSYDQLVMELCFLPENDAFFTIIYSKEGFFEEIRLRIDD